MEYAFKKYFDKTGTIEKEQVQKNVQLEKRNNEYKTYFHCKICKTDIYHNTEAFSHLGKYFVQYKFTLQK